jgi:hypothetical protein
MPVLPPSLSSFHKERSQEVGNKGQVVENEVETTLAGHVLSGVGARRKK